MKESVMGTLYEADLVAWANEQAALLRSGNLAAIDALNIAEEIESVGSSQRRELRSRMVGLIAHLLKWRFQPDHRSNSWRATIYSQRDELDDLLSDSPSLKHAFDDEKFLKSIWRKAVVAAQRETHLNFPDSWIWPVDLVLDEEFWPD
jgi:hypothetical protein